MAERFDPKQDPKQVGPQPPAAGTAPGMDPAQQAAGAPEQGPAQQAANLPDEPPAVGGGRKTKAGPAARPQRVRRVGTLTMGLALIFAGCGLAAFLFWPQFDLALFLRFSPLLLILLGCEVIFFSLFSGPGVKLKYDFLSVFLCFVLIAGSFCLSTASLFFAYYTPQQAALRAQLKEELQARAYALLGEEETVADCRCYLDLPEYLAEGQAAPTLEDPGPGAHMGLQVTLRGGYDDPQAFADDCARVRDLLARGGLALDGLYFIWSEETPTAYREFCLDLDGPFELDGTPAQLAQQVIASGYENGDEDSAPGSYEEGYNDGYAAGYGDRYGSEEPLQEAPAPGLPGSSDLPAAPEPPAAPNAPEPPDAPDPPQLP